MFDETNLYQSIYERLRADQRLDVTDPRYGEFGKNRSQVERSTYQKDGQSDLSRPEMFMTLNAIETLLLIDPDDGFNAIQSAGDFAERRLGPSGFVEVEEEAHRAYVLAPTSERLVRYISYRHTIAAALILSVLDRRPNLTEHILRYLISQNVQNADGGWPIADRIANYQESDLWTSGYAVQFLLYCQKSDESELEKATALPFEKTLSFFTRSYEDGWVYKEPRDRIDTTAHIYIELFPVLFDRAHPLLMDVPSRLATYVASTGLLDLPGYNQDEIYRLSIRIAFALKFAASLDTPLLHKYWTLRQDVLRAYSSNIELTTYDLCCLLTMLKDKSEGRKISLLNFWNRYGPLSKHIPILGKYVSIGSDVAKAMKNR